MIIKNNFLESRLRISEKIITRKNTTPQSFLSDLFEPFKTQLKSETKEITTVYMNDLLEQTPRLSCAIVDIFSIAWGQPLSDILPEMPSTDTNFRLSEAT